MKVLITGMSGTGKTAVTTELKARGFTAIETVERILSLLE